MSIGALQLPAQLIKVHAILGDFLPVEKQYGHLGVELRAQGRVGVNIRLAQRDAELARQRRHLLLHLVAEVAATACVQDKFSIRHHTANLGLRFWSLRVFVFRFSFFVLRVSNYGFSV